MTLHSVLPPGINTTLVFNLSSLWMFALSMGRTPSHHQKCRVAGMYRAYNHACNEPAIMCVMSLPVLM